MKCVTLIVLVLVANVSAWVKEMENPGLYEGDMVLSPQQLQEVKKGTFSFSSTSNRNKLWPNAVVPYEVSSDLMRENEAMSEINEAIKQYETYTCLQFKKRTNERAYIYFYRGGGCSSVVGYTGRRNSISLAKGCWWRTTIMHEIGHSLGFHHEQTRPDRDQYVKILYQNMASGIRYNFDKQKSSDIDSLNTPYDYRSMMHYSWNAFGRGGLMTIQTLDPDQQYEIGQDDGFSHIDVEQINKLYKCTSTYPTLPPYVKPPKGCYNLGGACSKSAMEGLCTRPEWKSYMQSKCRRSCGLCGSGPPPTKPPINTAKPPTQPQTTPETGGGDCRDRVIDCRRLGLDKCTHEKDYWVTYMKQSCRKFCNFC